MEHVGPDLGQKSLQKSRQILLRFFMRIFTDLGTILGGLGTLLDDFGGSRARPGEVLEASSDSLFGKVLPRGSPKAIFKDFGSIFGGLGLHF